MSTGKPKVIELFALAAQIGEEVGFSFRDVDESEPESSEHLNDDGAWEYHFETDPHWGFVMAGPHEPVETTYGDWGLDFEISPFNCYIFHDDALAGIINPGGGDLGGLISIDEVDGISDLEPVMCDAFERERDALREKGESR